MTRKRAPSTIAATNGVAADQAFASAAPPIYLSSTYAFKGFEAPRAYEYTRTSNPTRDLLSDTLAKLEGGAGAITLSSGMAAVNLTLATLGAGDLALAAHDCYSGVQRLLRARAAKGHFKAAFVDFSDKAALAEALDQRPKLVLLETPSNPLMRVVDVAAVCALAHERGAKIVVDNTFLSPALQRPIELGADFVVHSTTKFLNGHSDVVGGAVISANEADAQELKDWANIVGVTGSPFDAYLTLRGIRTLFPRVERQQRTAGALAQFLLGHRNVEKVHYPGLPGHATHEIAKRQQSGFGAMLSFEIAGGVPAVRRFVEATRVFTLAESLGGVESLVAHPATMTHASMTPEQRAEAGISESLLRLSVGLEDEGDLVADLEGALAAAG